VPTFVETKRSSDTRIRREIVGQMLDYAANGLVYWPADAIRERFEATHGDAAEGVLQALLPAGTTADDFWRRVNDNLRAGQVRLVFVADRIPVELQRVIEFLNEQMNPAEVLGIEVRQCVNGNGTMRTLVPHVVGQTARAQQVKSAAGGETSTTPMDALEGSPQALKARFESLKEYLLALGGVEVRWMRKHIAFARHGNFACVLIRPTRSKLLVYVKVDPDSIKGSEWDIPGLTKDVRQIGHYGTGDLEITIGGDEDLERAKPLLDKSYQSN